jgi:hypothetical protein
MSDTHEANIVRVGPILPHPNADKLELTMVGGYQVVIGKGNFKEGDLAVYIQPDSVVPQTEAFKFIWGITRYRPRAECGSQVSIRCLAIPVLRFTRLPIEVSAKHRRITVKRLRKEYSEGLLMPIADFATTLFNNPKWQGSSALEVGEDVAELLGITRHVPEFDAEPTAAETEATPKRKFPRSLKGWFYWGLRQLGLRNAGGRSYAEEVNFSSPEYDVNAFKNATRVTFREGEQVTVTEKIHGSNARYVFIPDNDKLPTHLQLDGKFYAGSHRQWKRTGDNVWWNASTRFKFIEEWCIQHPRQVLYGEVGPTQKGYRYGADKDETFFFAFDVYNSETGEWSWPGNVGIESTVPVLYAGPYSKDIIAKFVDGPSVVPGAKTIREGIVIHSRERRLKLKVVSNKFYEGDTK